MTIRETRLIILNCGAGVQSSALLLMSIKGILPRVDHAIFADTQYEPPAVYRHLEWLEGEAKTAGIPFHRVSEGNLRADAILFRMHRKSESSTGRKGYASIPLFVLNPDGSQGIIRRQCTSEYKIAPIERFIRREILGLKPRQRAPRTPVIDQWFGITWDEKQRMRLSSEPWKRNVYPFCGAPEPVTPAWVRPNGMPKLWRRGDCIAWLKENYPDREVPRSACICCPYRSNREWREMRDSDPASFADAVEFDAAIRAAEADNQLRPDVKEKLGRLVGTPFVHRSMKPLAEADLGFDGPGLWDGIAENDCEGICGV